MGEVVNLILPFFSTTKNYAQVLKRLASLAFYETFIITLLLRANPRIDAFFTSIESWGPIGKVARTIPHHNVLNLSGVVIGFIVAILTHTFHVHDLISDVLGIRRRFDRKHILIPLAQRIGSAITKDKIKKIAQQRDKLMHAMFYRYASSGAANTLVDKHDIEQALNAWSWFWVFIEAIFYVVVGAFIAWWFGSHNLALGFALVSISLLLIAALQRIRLGTYALRQIETIASDPTAAYEVKKLFDAL